MRPVKIGSMPAGSDSIFHDLWRLANGKYWFSYAPYKQPSDLLPGWAMEDQYNTAYWRAIFDVVLNENATEEERVGIQLIKLTSTEKDTQ